MNGFHPKFPFGKGIWIHDLPSCEGGNILAIIDKCKRYNISYLLIKSADGSNSYPKGGTPQLTREISDQLHANGIKIYSWSYVYGIDPTREADLALWSIEQLGVDGHVFDAESEYERLDNNVVAAETMFKIVRDKHPETFLAHAPYPYIKYHTAFPYVTFGKYCDAVMPQMYWGTIGVSVPQMVADMFEEWTTWQQTWTASGHGDSVKPIIPLGQGYDNVETRYTLTPSELTDFITQIAGYGSVNFWVWEYLVRDDLWKAIRDAQVKPELAFGVGPTNSQNQEGASTSTIKPQMPSVPQTQAPTTPENPPTSPQNLPSDTVNKTPEEENTPVSPPKTNTTTPIVVAKTQISPAGETTIVVKKDPSSPTGAMVSITHHKPHIDYLIAFFKFLFGGFKGGGKK